MKKKQTEELGHYYNEEGYLVFTAAYHLDRGYCCGNGCRHCPFEYINVPEPRRSELMCSPANQLFEEPGI